MRKIQKTYPHIHIHPKKPFNHFFIKKEPSPISGEEKSEFIAALDRYDDAPESVEKLRIFIDQILYGMTKVSEYRRNFDLIKVMLEHWLKEDPRHQAVVDARGFFNLITISSIRHEEIIDDGNKGHRTDPTSLIDLLYNGWCGPEDDTTSE